MLDTVKLASPFLDPATAEAVAANLNRVSSVELGSELVVWEFIRGSLAGSYDHRVSVQLLDQIAVSRKASHGGMEIVFEDCPPYLVIEGSVHKAMVGHNVYGGPTDIGAACRWFIDELACRLGCELPLADVWRVRRIDWAECFEVGKETMADFIFALGNASFPWRDHKTQYYPGRGLFVPGDMTTVKLYHKGEEFREHDAPRLRRYGRSNDFMDARQVAAWVKEVQERAGGILRAEVSIKARRLDDVFRHSKGAIVSDFLSTRDGFPRFAVNEWSSELRKLLREGKSDMDTVNTAVAVRKRLQEVYGASGPRASSKIAALFGTWMQLAGMGEARVKEEMSRSAFYRHRQLLLDAGCQWIGSDVQLVKRPAMSFWPKLTSPYRMTDKLPVVARLEERYGGLAA